MIFYPGDIVICVQESIFNDFQLPLRTPFIVKRYRSGHITLKSSLYTKTYSTKRFALLEKEEGHIDATVLKIREMEKRFKERSCQQSM